MTLRSPRRGGLPKRVGRSVLTVLACLVVASGAWAVDTDGDGLDDVDELVHGTDPANPDTDADQLLDGFEVDHAFDPLTSGETFQDADGDGLDNLAEQAGGTSPILTDTDGDNLSDYDERKRARTVGFVPHFIDDVTNVAWSFVLVSADLDGDGDGDIVARGGASSPAGWYENRSSESGQPFDFGPRQSLPTGLLGSSDLIAADLDQDGDPDVVHVSQVLFWLENRLNEPSADFAPEAQLGTGIGGSSWSSSLEAADADLDGDLDLFYYDFRDTEVSWWENRLNEPSSDFGPEVVISSSVSSVGKPARFVGDVDGDGDPDIVTDEVGSNPVVWWENRLREPAADFAPPQDIMPSSGTAELYSVGDIDRDGRVDVVTDKGLFLSRVGDPAGDFLFDSPSPGFTQADESADMDGDGDLDYPEQRVSVEPQWPADQYRYTTAWIEYRRDEDPEDAVDHVLYDSGVIMFDWDRREPSPADIDGDGDIDLMIVSLEGFVSKAEHWIWENPGTNPLDPDHDGDGFLDGLEVAVGTDPLDPNSFPSVPGLSWAAHVAVSVLLSWTAFRRLRSASNRKAP